MPKLLRTLGAAGCGAALAMCFTPFDQSWLVWGWMWVLFPLLWTTMPRKRVLRGFGLAWVCGFAFWAINLKWLGSVTWPGALALSAYLAVYFGIFGGFAATVANPWRRKYVSTQGIPARLREMLRSLGYAALLAGFWCGLEWVRGIFLTGFGWNGLGVSFANNLILAQSAEYVGVIGLAFLPVFMSAVAVQTARRFYQQFMAGEVKMLHWDFAAALLVVMAAFTLGTARLTSVTNAPKIEARVLLMQQNIPQVAGDVLWESDKVIDGFLDLTKEAFTEIQNEAGDAAKASKSEDEVISIRIPDLVIWPESAFSGRDFPFQKIGSGSDLVYPMSQTELERVRALGSFTFISGITEVEGESWADPEVAVYNSMLVDKKGGNRESYQKNHLVILGEYIPDLPFLHELYKEATDGAEMTMNTSVGGEFEPLRLRVGDQEVGMIPSICFEDTVQRVTRKFVRNEPQLLVNITNDGWFGESEGAAQHFQNAIFRSIELRRPMVRSANRGVTGVVSAAGALTDPYTRQRRSLVDENGSHFHRGYLLASVYIPAEGGITLYAAFGDWFAVTGLVVGLCWIIFRVMIGEFGKRAEE